jgi:Family of unknown function (DUF5706)
MSKKWRKGKPLNNQPDRNVNLPGERLITAAGQPGGLDRRDFLWKVIGRYDFYMGSVNAKAAFLIAFNAFVITGIVLKWSDILQLYGTKYPFANLVASILLAAVALASLVSLFFTFQAVNPFLKSPKDPRSYHSAVYFGHVAEYNDPEKYLSHVNELDAEKVVKDLAYQAHTLAKGTAGKFGWINWAIGAILYAEIPIFSLRVVIVVCVLIARQYTG